MPNINLQRTDPNAAVRAGNVGVATPDISTVQQGILNGAAQALGAKGQDKQRLAESIFRFGHAVAGFGQTVGGILGEEAQRTLRAETSLDFAALSSYAARNGQQFVENFIKNSEKTYNTQEELLKDAGPAIAEFVKQMSAKSIEGKTDLRADPNGVPPMRHAKEMGITADCPAIQKFEEEVAKGIAYQLCTQFQVEQTQRNKAIHEEWWNKQVNNTKINKDGSISQETLDGWATYFRGLGLNEEQVKDNCRVLEQQCRVSIYRDELGNCIATASNEFYTAFRRNTMQYSWDTAANLAQEMVAAKLTGYNKANRNKAIELSRNPKAEEEALDKLYSDAEAQLWGVLKQAKNLYADSLYDAADAILFNDGILADGTEVDGNQPIYYDLYRAKAPSVTVSTRASASSQSDGSDRVVGQIGYGKNAKMTTSMELKIGETVLTGVNPKDVISLANNGALPDGATITLELKTADGTIQLMTGMSFNDIRDQLIYKVLTADVKSLKDLGEIKDVVCLANAFLPDRARREVMSIAHGRLSYFREIKAGEDSPNSPADVNDKILRFLQQKGAVDKDVTLDDLNKKTPASLVGFYRKMALRLSTIPQFNDGVDIWDQALNSAYTLYQAEGTEKAANHFFVQNAMRAAFDGSGKQRRSLIFVAPEKKISPDWRHYRRGIHKARLSEVKNIKDIEATNQMNIENERILKEHNS